MGKRLCEGPALHLPSERIADPVPSRAIPPGRKRRDRPSQRWRGARAGPWLSPGAGSTRGSCGVSLQTTPEPRGKGMSGPGPGRQQAEGCGRASDRRGSCLGTRPGHSRSRSRQAPPRDMGCLARRPPRPCWRPGCGLRVQNGFSTWPRVATACATSVRLGITRTAQAASARRRAVLPTAPCRGRGRTQAPGSGGCCCPTGRETRCRCRRAALLAGR